MNQTINHRVQLIACLMIWLLAACCSSRPRSVADESAEAPVAVPVFDADSAYSYVAQQVAFGPRLLGSDAHEQCASWLADRLRTLGATVCEQPFEAILFNGTTYAARNIIGSFNTDARKRILLCAHWDSRPWADNDPDERNHYTPVLGANDGASGVGVLLEIARQVAAQAPALGVDILFFDAEDYGAPTFYKGEHADDYWCLGSQYWARRPHVEGYNARYAILLDMVGAKDARFLYEGFSLQYADALTRRIWRQAAAIGYASYFVAAPGGYVTDDHLFVNRLAHIPCVDIIPYQADGQLSTFGDFWHTVDDTIDNIDRQTLRAVGQTLLQVVYNEK